MIRLRKGLAPDILIEKAAEWTTEYLTALGAAGPVSDTVRYRYRHQDIKSAVRQDSHGKCMYCEQQVDFGEIDHIQPVSHCPDQIVDWDNLGLVCKECNTHKNNYYAPAEPLINPYLHDPPRHLHFLGPIVHPLNFDVIGYRTLLRLQLNRAALIQKRANRLTSLLHLVQQWKTYPDPATKEILWQAIVQEAADEKEFAATVRDYLRSIAGERSSEIP